MLCSVTTLGALHCKPAVAVVFVMDDSCEQQASCTESSWLNHALLINRVVCFDQTHLHTWLRAS